MLVLNTSTLFLEGSGILNVSGCANLSDAQALITVGSYSVSHTFLLGDIAESYTLGRKAAKKLDLFIVRMHLRVRERNRTNH